MVKQLVNEVLDEKRLAQQKNDQGETLFNIVD